MGFLGVITVKIIESSVEFFALRRGQRHLIVREIVPQSLEKAQTLFAARSTDVNCRLANALSLLA